MQASPESLLISSVLRTKDHVTVLSSGLTPDMFHAHTDEWEWITTYVRQHRRTPSIKAFTNRFTKFIVERVNDTPHFVEEVRQSHTRYKLIEMIDDVTNSLQAGNSPSWVLDSIGTAYRSMVTESIVGATSEADIIGGWEAIYDEAVRRVVRTQEKGLPGIPTGFDTLDLATGGIQPGHLWVIGARLGQGKTWTAIRLACSALMAGYSPLFFSLEQSKASIGYRIHSFLSASYHPETFRNADLNQGQGFSLLEYKKFLRRLGKMVRGRFYVNDSTRGRITPELVAAQIESVKPDIVFIDYLTLMARDSSDWQGVSKLIGDIKAVAERYTIPIVVLSQTNRLGGGQEPPGTENLSQSDSVGQDADAVVTIAKVSDHVVKLKLAKFRHGIDGQKWYAEFDVNNGLYREVSGDEAQYIKELDLEVKD